MKKIKVIIWFATGLLCSIGIAMVLRRLLALNGLVSSSNPMSSLGADQEFKIHALLTYLHIIPGGVFMISGPLQFSTYIRKRYPRFHRRNGYVFILSAYIIGITAFCMPFILVPIGGMNEAAATIFFSAFFLIAVSCAFSYILKKNIKLHREWMIRTFVVGLSIATIRPIVVLFFIFSKTAPAVFFGTAFWIGFALHLVLAEVWINYTRNASVNS